MPQHSIIPLIFGTLTSDVSLQLPQLVAQMLFCQKPMMAITYVYKHNYLGSNLMATTCPCSEMIVVVTFSDLLALCYFFSFWAFLDLFIFISPYYVLPASLLRAHSFLSLQQLPQTSQHSALGLAKSSVNQHYPLLCGRMEGPQNILTISPLRQSAASLQLVTSCCHGLSAVQFRTSQEYTLQILNSGQCLPVYLVHSKSFLHL